MQQVFTCFILVIAALYTGRILADINTKTNSKQQAIEGGNTTLLCTYTPQDGTDVTWSVDDGSDVYGRELISRNIVLDKRYDLIDQSLFISNVRQSDASTYICSIYSSVDRRSARSTVQLDVLYSPRFTLRKQGNSIQCVPYGNPAIDQVIYYINGTRQPDTVQVTIDERFCNTLTCYAENVAGEGNRTQIYCPKVTYSPDKPDDLGNQTLVGVLTSVLIFLLLSAIMLIVFLALRPGPNFELEERYGEMFTDGSSSV